MALGKKLFSNYDGFRAIDFEIDDFDLNVAELTIDNGFYLKYTMSISPELDEVSISLIKAPRY